MTGKPMALEFPIKLKFRNVDFCAGRNLEKYPWSKAENQQQTQPTLVGGEHSHHFAITGQQKYSF